MNKKAFTLLELLVVMAIVFICIIIIPSVISYKTHKNLYVEYNVQKTVHGVYYNVETKEVVQVSPDKKRILGVIGKIRCSIGEFEYLKKNEQYNQIEYYHKYETPVNTQVTNSSNLITINGINYQKVNE